MFVPCKTHPFRNKYHTTACDKSKVIFNVEIVEGKDRPIVMVNKEFGEKGDTDGLMVSIEEPLWGTDKVVIMDSVLCVLD